MSNEKDLELEDLELDRINLEDESEDDDATAEISPGQQKAMDDGWVDEAQWVASGRDADDWVDWKTFNRNGEMMGRIVSLGKKLTHVEQENARLSLQVRDQHEITRRMSEKAYERAKKELKAQYRSAMREGDFDSADQLEEQLDDLEETKKKADATPAAPKGDDQQQPQLSPNQMAFVAVLQENSDWTEQQRVAFAQAMEEELVANPNMGVRQFNTVMDAYIEGKPRRGAPPITPTPRKSTPNSGQSAVSMNELDDFEKDIVDTWVDMGAYPDTKKGREQAIRDIIKNR